MLYSYRLLLALLLAASAFTSPVWAQQPALPAGPPAGTGSITGVVLDSLNRQPVPYATVVLLPPAPNEKAITGIAADDNGRFTFTKLVSGPARLRISYVGYGTQTRAVTITAGATDAGTFRLPTAGTALAEAVIIGTKPVVEVRPDRIVYNAEQDVSNAGGTAADVLRKAPLLAVDGDDKVTLRGSSNFRVLVNGKPSPTFANNLADALKSLPADQIKSVEIITTPPAKYDGEGTAGIINIVLKKGVDRGLNGRVGLGGGNRGLNSNASLNFKKGKVGLSVSGGTGRWYGPQESARDRTDFFVRRPDGSPAQLTQTGSGRFGGRWGYGNLTVDYDPAEYHSFSLSAGLNPYSGSGQQVLRNRYNAGNPVLDQLFVRDTENLFSGFNGEVTGTYTRTFKQARREWSILGQAADNSGTFGYDVNQFDGTIARPVEQASYRERSRGRTPGTEFTLQTDFVQPLSEKQTLEMGLKSIWRRTGSVAEVDTFLAGQQAGLARSRQRSTNFDYRQNVQAAYATYSFTPFKKLNMSLGARAERTNLTANLFTPVRQPEFGQTYTSLLPNGNAQYAFSEMTSLRLAYSRRITRPFIDYLNPFVDRSDTLNLRTGNPELNPELTDSYELSYNTLVKTATLSVSASVRRTDNAIEAVRRPAADVALPDDSRRPGPGVIVETFQNVAANTNYQLNFYGSVKPNKNWDLSGGSNVEYIVRRSPALGITRRGVTAGLNVNTSYKLPKDFTASAFAFASLPSIDLQGRGGANLYYNLGLKKTFLDKKADFVVNVTAPFNNYWDYRSRLETPSFEDRTVNRNFQRSFRLSFSYRFGQAQQGKQRKSISNDDVKGGGGNKQGGQ
ncbi:TonB-dependent receptor domain-containing protein [Hymenobacter sp. IS2118]|uniref:TonB-dependent receptor domain-containing protein n=1 Tax=Hymenobacter sp. IS2118 TaxID=1505605 RepID=UPI000550600A|nr:TonB-dependent receptor [Hymenobacter sp. IS2118]